MTLTEKDSKQLPAWLRERIGDVEQARAELRQSTSDSRWLAQEYDRLLESHDGQWIAVRHKAVQAHAATLEELLAIIDAGTLPRRAYAIEKVFRRQTKLVV